MFRRTARWLFPTLALIVGAGLIAWAPYVEARERGAGRTVRSFDQTMTLGADGYLDVSTTFAYDFGDNPGHGPVFSIVTRDRYDEDHDIVYTLRDVRVSSPDAPAAVAIERSDWRTALYIGDPVRGGLSGVREYTVSYRIGPVLRADDGAQELYWNIFAPGSVQDVENIAVVIVAGEGTVGQPTSASCATGPVSSDTACASAAIDDRDVTASQPLIRPDESMTLRVRYPAEFADLAAPQLAPRVAQPPGSPRTLAVDTTPGVMRWAGSILLAGALFGLVYPLARRRDLQYVDVPPGVLPGPGETPRARRRWRAPAVAVRFDPPSVSPAEAGLLQDGRYDAVDLAAGLVDLAGRGHIAITARGGSEASASPRWDVERLAADPADLTGWERDILVAVFGTADPDDPKPWTTSLTAAVQARSGAWRKARNGLIEAVRGEGWFTSDVFGGKDRLLTAAIALWIFAAFFLLLGVGGLFSHNPSALWFAACGAALVVVGLIAWAARGSRVIRTARGTAVLDQTRSFRRFIDVADAAMIRDADRDRPQDLFLRYLPWAMIFGLTERWSALFVGLAREAAAGASVSASDAVGPGPLLDPAIVSLAATAPALAGVVRQALPSATDTGSSSSGDSSSSGGDSGSSSSSGSSGGASSGGGGGGVSIGGW